MYFIFTHDGHTLMNLGAFILIPMFQTPGSPGETVTHHVINDHICMNMGHFLKTAGHHSQDKSNVAVQV